MRFIAIVGALLWALGLSTSAPAQTQLGSATPKTCKELKEGLPTQDPMFQLTGRITLKSGLVYDVKQFGKPGNYYTYVIETPAPGRCTIPFYQISTLDFDRYTKRWQATLENGQIIEGAGGMSYAAVENNRPGYREFVALVASPGDQNGPSWLHVVAQSPRHGQPTAVALNPRDIDSIEIINPSVATTSITPPSLAGPKLKFEVPAEYYGLPPTASKRSGILLLFKAPEKDGAMTLTNLYDVAENPGKLPRTEPGKQELVWVSNDGKQAAPLWGETVAWNRDNKRFSGDLYFRCMKSYGRWTDADDRQGRVLSSYNPCASALMLSDNAGTASAANAVAAVLTLGLAAVTGQHEEKRIDSEKIRSLLANSTAEIEEKLGRLAARRYKEEFAGAKSADQMNAFVAKYEAFDPEGLVAQMRLRLGEAEKTKSIAESSLAQFRSAIRLETDTNCGPALEVRGNLVKVYKPVNGFGNEHWIKRDDLFPKGKDCSFKDGQYVPPKG